jgi:NADP-dependent 3-hydroxy acid dehydrogenase YdfG
MNRVSSTTVALVTGAGRGIGAALSAALAKRGARVACADLDMAAARETATRVGGLGLGLDVRDAAMWANAVAQTEAAFGPLTVLINNAGVLRSAWALDQSEADMRAMMETNLLGAALGVQAVLPGMRARKRGRIVTIGSMASYLPLQGQAFYAATKHALRAYHFGVAAEEGDGPVRFTLVSPGAVDTAMIAAERANPAAALSFAGKPVSAQEVAAATLWAIDRDMTEICAPARGATLAKLIGLFPNRARGLIDKAHAAGRARRSAQD